MYEIKEETHQLNRVPMNSPGAHKSLSVCPNLTANTTSIRRAAVRETGLSLTEDTPPLKPLGPSQHYRIEGFRGGGGGDAPPHDMPAGRRQLR